MASSNGHAPSTNGHSLTEEQYDDYMEVVTNHSGSLFIQFRMDHSRYLKGDCDAVAVLGYLLNLLRLKDANPKDRKLLVKNNLWFKCPAKDIQKHFGMGRDRQQRAIDKLEKTRIIEVIRKKGVPPTMWIKVSTEKLKKIQQWDRKQSQKGGNQPFKRPESPPLKSGEPSQRKGGDQPFHIANNLPKSSSNSLPPTGEQTPAEHHHSNGRLNGFSSNKHAAPSEECLGWAKEFRKILRDNNRPLTDWSDRKGAEAFQELLKSLNNDSSRISRFLSNYRRYISQIERPTITSVHKITNLDFFVWIEDQLKRLKKRCPYETVKEGDQIFALVPNCDGFSHVPVEELGRWKHLDREPIN